MKRRSIHRFWAVIFVLIAVEAAIGLAVWQWPRLFPSHYVSEVYRSYADQPGIDATFLRDFPVNDTLSVDATLLQALDSLGWERLKKDFHALDFPERTQKKIEQGVDIISLHLAPKSNPTLPMDTTDILNNDIVAISRLHWTVCIFHITSMAERDAVSSSQYRKGYSY